MVLSADFLCLFIVFRGIYGLRTVGLTFNWNRRKHPNTKVTDHTFIKNITSWAEVSQAQPQLRLRVDKVKTG